MGPSARVKSIDALQAMSAALECFHADASSGLDDLDMEIRRALQWINQDCRQYWQHEVRLARDNMTEARLQLQNAMMFRRIDEEQKASCVEEKKALERAKRRLENAEKKVEAIPHWIVAIERAVNEYRGCRSQFVTWLEADFPRAVAALGRMIANLETYVHLQTPTNDPSPIDWTIKKSTLDAQPADATENKPQIKNPET